MEPQAADDAAVEKEIAFWQRFITWWAQTKSDPLPAWAAMERAQGRAELVEDAGSDKYQP